MGEVSSHVWRTTALAPVGFGEASIVEPRWFLVQTQEPWLTARMANLKETAQAENIGEEDTYPFCDLIPGHLHLHSNPFHNDAVPISPSQEPLIASITIEIRQTALGKIVKLLEQAQLPGFLHQHAAIGSARQPLHVVDEVLQHCKV